jgi:hypothetical protein
MSGLIWAKVVNDEIMQLHDEDPSGLWHPDLLADWKQVPDVVHIGWKFKNGQWIDGGTWHEEFMAENPPPPPGPPSGSIGFALIEDKTTKTCKVSFTVNPAGIFDTYKAIIDGVEYVEKNQFELEIAQEMEPKTVETKLVVEGPGGTYEYVYENDEALIIPEMYMTPLEKYAYLQSKK